ncbi:hypothetical protein ACFX11_039442 [Malus domestica]
MAGYGEWTKAAHVWDFIDIPRPLAITVGERRHAEVTKVGSRKVTQRAREENTRETSTKNALNDRDLNPSSLLQGKGQWLKEMA